MSYEINSDNGVNGTGIRYEGPSPGRCSVERQHGPGRHPATARNAKRRKWTQEENRIVMECFYQSNPDSYGYRKRMHNIWTEKNMFPVTEQRLQDQKSNIIKKGWFSKLELEEIKNHIVREDGAHEMSQDDISGTSMYEDEQDHNFPEAEESLIFDHQEHQMSQDRLINVVEGVQLTDDENRLLDLLEVKLISDRIRLPPLRGVDKRKLENAVGKINEVLAKVVTFNITMTNDLIYAGAAVVTDMVGRKNRNRNVNVKEPPWKKRLELKVKELNKDLGRINVLIKKQKVKQRLEGSLQKKYKIKEKGLTTVREEIKQRISATSSKIKRYSNRIRQYQQNRQFVNNQRRFFQEVDGQGQQNSDVPDANEAKLFWSNIWSKEVKHSNEAEWLKGFRDHGFERQRHQQPNCELTRSKLKKVLARIPNWKAPGPDMVQGFWIKHFTSLHEHLLQNYKDCLTNKQVPTWLTKGRTVLIQKDKLKGNDPSNYRPITCLPITWKILTGMISEEIYSYLNVNGLLPEEQKGCRKKSRGTGDLLYIDKTILKEVKTRKKNLAMAWIDYRKAFDSVPHSWILECLDLLGVNRELREFLEESMKSWQVQLFCGDEILGEVNIKRGIFQGDSLSPLLFVISLIPLTHVLRASKPGYEVSNNKEKINHLLYMDDLKLYGKNEKEINSLVQTVRIFSKDICMDFGIDKCATLVLKRGILSKSEGINLPDDKVIKSVNADEGYKYLGVLQANQIMNRTMKTKICKEYKRRVRKLLETKLNSENLIKAINTWAVSLLRYSAAFLDWTKEEIQGLDRNTRKLMTMHKALHPKSDVDRLYLKRKDGGRGLLSIEDTVSLASIGLIKYIEKSEERIITAVRGNDLCDGEDEKQFKKRKHQERKKKWHDKALHGQFLRQTEEETGKDQWQWLRSTGIKRETESLIMAAQEQAIRTNAIKAKIDKSQEESKCRMCGKVDETINHLLCECSKMAQREYKRRHDWLGKRVHWEVCRKLGFETKEKWYEHQPESVYENDDYKVLWDFNIQTDHVIEARRPDLVIINKQDRMCQIVDFAVPYDSRVNLKETEKITKYQDLARELQKLWNMRVKVIPIIIGALGTTPKKLEQRLMELGIKCVTGEMQKTVILNSARILRKVLEI